jgi:pimeloyl-ACP methyl ester carboxylesterase
MRVGNLRRACNVNCRPQISFLRVIDGRKSVELASVLRALRVASKAPLLLLLLGPLLGVAFARGSIADGGSDGRASYAPAPCPNPILVGSPQFDLGADFECGYLTVPENRALADDRTVRIAVARLKATAPNPKPDPIVFLTGGPGGSGLAEGPSIAKGWNVERDVIFIDQRGELKSDPFLSCPEIDQFQRDTVAEAWDNRAYRRRSGAATRACRDRLQGAGWDLSAYNTTENAADVADLRVALGIDQWNIYGVSYGSDLALQTLRDHPQGIRTMVLDGVFPPQFNVVEEGWDSTAQSYRALFDDCAAETACNAAYPDVRAEFTGLVKFLTQHPRTITVIDPATGQGTEVVIDGYKLANLVDGAMFTPGSPARIPSLVHNLATGGGTEAAMEILAQRLPPDFVGYGLEYGALCSEMVANTNWESVQAIGKKALPDFPDSVLSLVPQFPWIFHNCRLWQVQQADSGVSRPARSDIPVLMVSGALDPATPPSNAEIAARTLPNSHRLIFPGSGHAIGHFSQVCLAKILQSFLDSPQDFDVSCLRSEKVPTFQIH